MAGDFGGVWYWNRFPGIQCDNDAYCYIPMLEELDFVPSKKYADGAEIFEHCKNIGKHFGLYDGAIFSTLAKGESWTTLELKLNFVRAMSKDTGPVRAEGRIIHRGLTVATSEGTLKDRAGKLYAHATTTCMIFPVKS